MAKDNAVTLYYDGDCPFCNNYVQMVHIQKTFGAPTLINLRDDTKAQKEFSKQGYDVDKGMVVEMDGQIYFGAEAINKLALISTPQSFFNVMNRAIFSNKILSLLLYPIMVLCRNVTLMILGREKINKDANAIDTQSIFKIFSWFWGLYAVFHFNYLLYYSPQLSEPPNIFSYIGLSLAFFLLVKPGHQGVFIGLITLQTIDMILKMPTVSNHSIIELFFTLSVLVSILYAAAKSYSFERAFTTFATTGRWLLIIMYFFGIFHKINADFLNPESSCAVFLWVQYPFPDFILNAPIMHYAAIYGTFIIEGLVMIGLFIPKTRYCAFVVGFMFHIFLGLNGNAYYPAFSALSLALHALFLPAMTYTYFKNSKIYAAISNRHNILFAMVGAIILGLIFAAMAKNLIVLISMFGIISLLCLGFILIYARDCKTSSQNMMFSGGFIAFVFATLFFINNAFPYVGFKTHQAMNMFSNLQIEDGRSNHLIINPAWDLFPYTNDTVRGFTLYQDNEPVFENPDLYVTYYDFLNRIERFLDGKDLLDYRVSYTRNGEIFSRISLMDLEDDMNTILHSRFLRKYIHFAGLSDESPRQCYKFQVGE